MALKAVLFDNDGTLVDTHDLLLESFRFATRQVLDKEIPDDVLMAKVGQPLVTMMSDFTDDPAVVDELVRVYRGYNEAIHDERISLFPGVAEGVRRLHEAGFALGVVTSKMHPLAEQGLKVLDLNQYMSCLIGANDCPKHKPDPAPVELACKLLGLRPEECAFVGDSPFDIHAGNAAGCVTAGVLYGMFPEERLREENADYICETFDELVDLLIGLKGQPER